MATIDKIITLLIVLLVYCSQIIVARLMLLNVIFRHGDRTPDSTGIETYPNDPYIGETYYPYGIAGLTNTGKMREYHLGKYLRDNYEDFLGDTYLVDEVKGRSTDIDRTKMSLQLILAGIYPPNDVLQWNPELDWQPIPTEYVPVLDDNLLLPDNCPKYLKARESVEGSQEFQRKLSKYKPLMRKLTEWTGKNINNTNDMYVLYHGLLAQSSMDLKLPEWTNDIFPYGELRDGVILEYELQSYNDQMKRLNGGMLLRKITDDMTNACLGKLNPKRKLFLYAAHETNIAALMQTLGVYFRHVPRFSSAVIIELHEDDEGNKNHFVRVRYYRGLTVPGKGEPLDRVMKIPGCKRFCVFQQFKRILKNVTARNNDIPCDKRSLKSYLESDRNKLPLAITVQILSSILKEESIPNGLH